MNARDGLPQHLLGFNGQPDWLDMSDYLVHFTRSEANFRSILRSGHLKAGRPFGWARRLPPVQAQQQSACLSEVPLGRHDRLIDRHGEFGIGFSRTFIKAQGGARVWYLDDGSMPSRALFARIGEAIKASNWTDELWNLTPFIDRVIPGKYEWDWEREWRVPGGFHFTFDDVALAITPDGVEEHPGLSAPMLHPGNEAFWVPSVPDALGREVEAMVVTFLENFEHPANSLPVEHGEYIWMVEKWDTENAVMHSFDDREPLVLETLCDRLNDISPEWVRIAEWEESLYE